MLDEAAARTRFAAALGGDRRFELSRRETRWLAIADDVVAFAADDATSWQRLAAEAWLLGRWRAAGIPAPRVIREDPTRHIQILERLHGRTGDAIHTETGSSPLYPSTIPDVAARLDAGTQLTAFGERLATSYGELAARIRRAVSLADAATANLAPTSRRTLDVAGGITLLHATSASPAAKRNATRARDWLAALPPADAVIHADLHFFNLCVADDGTITGVFDAGDAGPDCAATELMYLHSLGARFTALALAAYDHPIDPTAVRWAHLRTVLDHLICHGPTTPRHPSIVRWATAAFEHLT